MTCSAANCQVHHQANVEKRFTMRTVTARQESQAIMTSAATPPIVRTIAELRAVTAAWRKRGQTCAMVPTMGALHAGHLSLVDYANSVADHVVVSIFVNPTQFAPNEDFDAYPRTEEEDCKKLAAFNVGVVFAPNAREMYPDNFCSAISVNGPAQGLESDSRPHFFGGVATVVTKLLLALLPDIAIFGEKDFQQLRVIEQVTSDLNLPVKILGGPTMREADGLAMSSRNAYLSADERATSVQLITIMRKVAAALQNGAAIEETLQSGLTELKAAGFKPDYLSLNDARSLQAISRDHLDQDMLGTYRLLAAVWLGKTRLIDNIEV